ncbi:hypothetical protein [Nonomuraea zeae]|uniref:Secreted protein n=1 Tax=Nonomuraea zeae TaxID=1642303 RepID=A0A5S4FYM0_9ACTN|nr:hypothetical protein [Nonomuraea zeae]TMR25364.1 hypothetical protein ETD85_45450 [Nonomuraea zeae]
MLGLLVPVLLQSLAACAVRVLAFLDRLPGANQNEGQAQQAERIADQTEWNRPKSRAEQRTPGATPFDC